MKPIVAHYFFCFQGKEYFLAKRILLDGAVRYDAIRKSEPFRITYGWVFFVIHFYEYIFKESAFRAVNTGILIHLLA